MGQNHFSWSPKEGSKSNNNTVRMACFYLFVVVACNCSGYCNCKNIKPTNQPPLNLNLTKIKLGLT